MGGLVDGERLGERAALAGDMRRWTAHPQPATVRAQPKPVQPAPKLAYADVTFS